MGVEPGKSKNEAAENMVKDMKSALDETHKALFNTAEQMKDRAERRHSKAPDYKSRKLTEKWIWPYQIKEVKPNAVELELPKQMRVVPTVNVSRVKPYKGPTFNFHSPL
ncbi:hypothetical protein SERLA73DRAFT_70193 [Serpula lacrymans var. lacrymans S7.3]|uniref:Tf2-1-like SH3-like domain-containing protein n=2 Tax=Serpula lacrymans var. lacrymans TaxID=341189 RepID=F8PM73_SERL3|nr:uncharacterized protein SERLADRAFT_434323 [Serpula lacrymans var. lacrymans S7.9]EGO02705.1 hypothetical protein SERLA73DRAFT_70193 [Serpula lacrymans var. lacrymans S7.3]EGO28407.1 hypothetical protein SERLADRAFT_434323 [Serpula lacrymans var. lacrymans S7.9]